MSAMFSLGKTKGSAVAVDGLMAMRLLAQPFQLKLVIAATGLGIMLRGRRHAERYRDIMYKPLKFNIDTSIPPNSLYASIFHRS